MLFFKEVSVANVVSCVQIPGSTIDRHVFTNYPAHRYWSRLLQPRQFLLSSFDLQVFFVVDFWNPCPSSSKGWFPKFILMLPKKKKVGEVILFLFLENKRKLPSRPGHTVVLKDEEVQQMMPAISHLHGKCEVEAFFEPYQRPS